MDEQTHPAPPAGLLDGWPTQVAAAVATGVATAYMPVQSWSRGVRWSLHGGTGAIAALGAAVTARQPGLWRGDDDEQDAAEPLPVLATLGVAALAGATMAAVSRGGESADGWVERGLAARGVRRPRVWMGVGAAALSLAMSAAERRRPAVDDDQPD